MAEKPNPTTETTLGKFLIELLANQISKSTQNQYRYLLTALSRRYPAKSFEEMSGDDLKEFFADMDGRKAKSSINQHRAMIKRFYKWLEGGDEEYPAKVKWIKIGAPKTTVQRGDLITKEEMGKLLNVARDYMEKALLVMLYESGARISEFCSITIKDLRINSDEVLVTIRRGKTGPRSLTLIKTLSPLKTYLNLLHPRPHDPDAQLFFRNNRPVSPLTVKRILDKLAQLANIQRRINPHIFRHSRATELARRGWNESKMRYYLGWSPTSSMPSIYVHLAFGDTRNEIRQMEGLSVEDDGLMSSEGLNVETPFEIETQDALPDLLKHIDVKTLLNHPDMVKHLDELICARVEEQYGNWEVQVETGELSDALDKRTDKISVAVKEAVRKIDKTAVVGCIEVGFPEIHKIKKK